MDNTSSDYQNAIEKLRKKVKSLEKQLELKDKKNEELPGKNNDKSASDGNNDELFLSLFSHMSDGVAMYKIIRDKNRTITDFVIDDANPSYLRFTKKNKENVIGTSFSDLFDNNVQQRLTLFTKVAETNHSKSFEAYISTLKKHFMVSVFNVAEDKLAAIFSDISKIKKAEEKILFERNLFQTLLDKFPDTIYFKDRDARFIKGSLSITQAFNTTPNEIIGKTDFDFFPKELAEQKYKDEMNIIETGIPIINKEEIGHETDGKARWVLTTKMPLFGASGDIEGIFGVSRDITDRKDAQEKELLYNNNFRTLSQTAFELLEKKTIHGIFNFVCEKLQKHFEDSLVLFSIVNDDQNDLSYYKSNTKKNLEISSILDILNSDGKGKIFENQTMLKLIQSGVLIKLDKGLKEFAQKADHKKSIDLLTSTLEINHTQFVGLVQNNCIQGIIIVLTKENLKSEDKYFIETFLNQASIVIHRKELESELIVAKEKAEESDNLKTSFLANLSHEIRTPVTGIQGFAELLRNVDLPLEKRIEYIDIINSKSEQLVQIISDIIDISKIEANQIHIDAFAYELSGLLKDLTKLFEKKITESYNKNLTLNSFTNISAEESLVYIDSNRVKQVLSNLLSNAIKFTKEGNIEFGYTIDNKMVLFFVRDTGIGIQADMRDLVFERFRQVDGSNTRKYGGTGLGLAISKKLVELMGGEIWIEPTYVEDFNYYDLLNPVILNKSDAQNGIGSTFYFTIPYNPLDNSLLSESTKDPETDVSTEDIWANKKIMIVEDDEINYQYIKETLSLFDVALLRFDDGKSAVEYCEKQQDVNMILMDIQLPVMNGYEATRLIRIKNKDVPIIVQTAFALSEDLEKAKEAGCTDYITKPYGMDELINIIEKYIA